MPLARVGAERSIKNVAGSEKVKGGGSNLLKIQKIPACGRQVCAEIGFMAILLQNLKAAHKTNPETQDHSNHQ